MDAVGKLKAYIALSKPFKFLTMIFPFLLGTVIAIWDVKRLDLGLFIISFLALLFAVESAYVQNEVADLETDSENPSSFTGGTKVLIEGLVSPKEANILVYGSALLAILFGLIFVFKYRFSWWFYFFCVFTFIIAYGYTGWPFKFAHRGLGEITLVFTNAFAPTLAAYILQARRFSWLPIILALPYMVAVFPQKILREFPDYEPDIKAGKRNLVVRFGREKMAKVYIIFRYLYIASVIFVAAYLFLRGISVLALLPMLYLIYSAKKLIDMAKSDREFFKNYELLKVMSDKGFKLMFDTCTVLILVLFLDVLIKRF